MSDVTLNDLLEAGSHFGHQTRRWNPKMSKYIYTQRDGVHIFDLVKTKAGLDAAVEFVKQVSANGGKVLFVGTKRQAADMVKHEAQRVGMPFITVRWMGGMLTNFTELSKRIRLLGELKEKRASGELKKYTKKEQLLFDREIAKLEKFFEGVTELTKMPEAMFVVDSHREEVAVREANRMNVPVIALVDSNGNPDLVDYVIPINDDAAKSIELVVTAVADAVLDGKPQVTSDGQTSELKTKTKKAKKKL